MTATATTTTTTAAESPDTVWTPRPGKALVLRASIYRDWRLVSAYDMSFEWPMTPGTVVEARTWDPAPTCGNGLHGLLWGTGEIEHLGMDDAVYQVVEVDLADTVMVGDKVKFPRCVIVYTGSFARAARLINTHAPGQRARERKIASLSRWRHRAFAVDLDSNPHLADEAYESDDEYRVEVPVGPLARVISSEVTGMDGWHTIALDVDHPVRVLRSSTPGHHHVYIDVLMPWWKYRRLLKALARAGVIEDGYYSAAVARRATHLRLPWVRKAMHPQAKHSQPTIPPTATEVTA